ncbi:MAG: hypothetical protein ACOYM9_00480 [Bradymonadia bacterium]|jgi:hypothetical protein
MKRARLHTHFGLLALLVGFGCRPDPGAEDYASQEAFRFDAGDPRPEAYVEGPDPWREGEPRFGLGLFYEDGRTEEVVIDDVAAHFYIYENTFTVVAADNGQREGLSVDQIVHAGTPWWGGGVHLEAPRDLSAWKTLHVSLRSSDGAFRTVSLGMTSGAEGSPDNASASVDATEYGYENDGRWHDLKIPIADLVAKGLDPAAVTVVLLLGGGSGTTAESLAIDALYLTQD